MENSGQPGGFFGENVGEGDLPSYMNSGTDSDPTNTFDVSEYLTCPLNPTMETVFNSHQRIHQAGTIHPISFCGQPSSDQTIINVQTTHSPKKTAEQQARRREINRKSRAKKKNEEIEMKDEMKKLRTKNAELERLQSLRAVKYKPESDLESDLENLKQERDEPDALFQEKKKKKSLCSKPHFDLQKDLKFIKEGDKHARKPTQDQSPTDEESHSEKEISASNLDGDDSEDDNDYKRKKKRAARSAPSEVRSGKVPKFACYDTRADQRHGSTNNHTAMVRDSYSIAKCLRILNTMGNIPYPIVKKATAKFKSPDDREIFVELRADWRIEWVKDLKNDA